VSPSSKLIAVCTNKGLVIIYRVSDGRKLHQLVDTDTRQKNLPAVTCHWINDDKLVAGYCDGKIKVLSQKINKKLLLNLGLECEQSAVLKNYRRRPNSLPNDGYSNERCPCYSRKRF